MSRKLPGAYLLEIRNHQKKSGAGHDLAAGAMQTRKKGVAKRFVGHKVGHKSNTQTTKPSIHEGFKDLFNGTYPTKTRSKAVH